MGIILSLSASATGNRTNSQESSRESSPDPQSTSGSTTRDSTNSGVCLIDRTSTGSTAPNSTSTYRYSQEPFSTFQHKVRDLCIAIGLGAPTAITQMKGGGYNRIIGLDIPNLPPAIIRIPRTAGFMRQLIHDQHALSLFLGNTAIPVPETIAYDATIGNQIESEYIIQRRVPGVSLEEIYYSLGVNEKEHIMDQIIELLAEMEIIQFPATGQLMATGFLPDASIVGGSDTSHPASVTTGSFAGYFERPQPGPTPTTLEDVFADRLRVWDEEREEVPMFERLAEIIAEIKSLAFFEQCSFAPNVLHHWDFEPRNIMVEGENGIYKVTALLDWDSVRSVPLVLARRPPAWLWLPKREMTSSQDWWDGDVDELELGPAELRTLFERKVAEKLGHLYLEDAFGKGRWIRRIWKFLLNGFDGSEDFKRFDRFEEEWNRYRESIESAA